MENHMKRGTIWILLTCVMVTSLVLASCAKTTATTSTSVASTTSTTSRTTTTTTSPTSTTSTTTTSATGNWWDKLGNPQYGGTMTLRLTTDTTHFDGYNMGGNASVIGAYDESLYSYDWTLDPAVFNYQLAFCPNDFTKGQLAQSYEMPDPLTVIFHLRQGIHWQNIPPANGREFVADDVIFNYDRNLGTGHGYTSPGPNGGSAMAKSIISITAPDKYTVVFKFKGANSEAILEYLLGPAFWTLIQSPDAIKQWGDLSDWHHAIGTGPFILKDYISGSAVTLVKNPDYYGYDERHPNNKLPYVDTLQYLIIPDNASAMAALRSGKIDVMDSISLQDSQAMQKTNPEITQISYPPLMGVSLDPRNDKAPFTDIKVREAMQKAIDLPTIDKTLYANSVDPYPETFTSSYMTGWGFPYTQWPQDLKDQYSYDPAAAKKLLADAGFPNGFKTDCVAQSVADMDLLQVIKSYLAAVNVNMDIQVMDPTSWMSYVQLGHKNDALAFKSIGLLGMAYAPLSQTGTYWSQNTNGWAMVNDPNYDALNAKAQAATSSLADVKQALKDMNELVARQHYSVALLLPPSFALCEPWLKGFNEQSGSISGMMTAGPSPYFWLARFWIDKSIKK